MMTHYFDTFGWYSETPISGRSTDIPIPSTPLQEGHGWNFTGYEWLQCPLVPVVEPAPEPDKRLWWVNVGPFKDRLGMDALAVAASNHDVCKAMIEMLVGRVYIDLKDTKVRTLLNMMVQAQQPTANQFFPGSGPLTAAKVTTILDTPTTEEERYVKGL